jgi:y4mF family transcriptional regulator
LDAAKDTDGTILKSDCSICADALLFEITLVPSFLKSFAKGRKSLNSGKKLSKSDHREHLGNLIARHRKHRGFNQSTLAQAAGVSRNFVREVEEGTRNASIELLLKLAKALGPKLLLLAGVSQYAKSANA